MSTDLPVPYGGTLVNPMVDASRRAAMTRASRGWPSWDLTPRQLCDLELLLNGGFSPLNGFMPRADYESVCAHMRLSSGLLWPMPIALSLSESAAAGLTRGSVLALRDPEGVMLAAVHVDEVWQPDREAEAIAVFGTNSVDHPGVAELLNAGHPCYVAGRLEGIQLPSHYDYRELRRTPAAVRREFSRLGWRRTVAFQTRNPMHRAHQELTRRAMRESGATLLIHPVVGLTKPGDLDHYVRVRCYQALLPEYPPGQAMLTLLPLAMRMAGPREALWHAIIRKNYGCTHFIVGRDHAGPGSDRAGTPFYGPYDAQALVKRHEQELGVVMVPFKEMVYVESLATYVPEDEVPPGKAALKLSGTQLRNLLLEGREIPSWFTFPKVADALRLQHPPRRRQGYTVFMTGLSGSGKSTIANALLVKLLELGGRSISLLDGDVVRKHLSSELGFSKEHRDINIRRIGFVASEITKNGGVAICAPIAPYDHVREEVRRLIANVGGFLLVYVSTPLEICEARDRKGLYDKARAGMLANFTGISDPYEPPAAADVVIDTTQVAPEDAAEQILRCLEREGFIERSAE